MALVAWGLLCWAVFAGKTQNWRWLLIWAAGLGMYFLGDMRGMGAT